MVDQVVRNLDEEGVGQPDRLRLIMLYLLFRDGLLPADTTKLLAHAQLAQPDGDVVRNLGLLGARVARPLKDTKSQFQPLFQAKPPSTDAQEEYSLSRFKCALKCMLEDHVKNTLDQENFPYTKPQLVPEGRTENVPQASLRSAKPTWAKSRSAASEPRQRVIMFMAGGATYSESRACYETMQESSKDIYLITSHMLTPSLFVRQVGDLSVDKRRLALPMEQPKPKAPAHLFEAEAPPPVVPAKKPSPAPQKNVPPSAQMGAVNLNGPSAVPNGSAAPRPAVVAAQSAAAPPPQKEEKKKKHGLFHRSKK